MFCEKIKILYGIDEFKMLSKDYMDKFEFCKNLLPQMYNFNKRTRHINAKSMNAITINSLAFSKVMP